MTEQQPTEGATEQRPLLQVVNPDATPEEIAAVVAVLSALGSAGGAPARKPVPSWNAPHRLARRSLPHGAGGWRTSGLPR